MIYRIYIGNNYLLYRKERSGYLLFNPYNSSALFINKDILDLITKFDKKYDLPGKVKDVLKLFNFPLPNNKILISIIIPVYNRFQFLKSLVASINNQKYIYEIIFIDDGSDENLCPQLSKMSIPFDYKCIRLESNSGVANARNIGASNAVGNYLLFLDSDDSLTKNSIEIFYSEIIISNFADILFGNLYHVDGKNRIIEEDIVTYPQYITKILNKWDLFIYGFAQLGAMCIRKDFFHRIGGFDARLQTWQDRDLSYRILYHAKNIVFIPEFLLNWNVGSHICNTTPAVEFFEDEKAKYISPLNHWPLLIKDPIFPNYKELFSKFFLEKRLRIKTANGIIVKLMQSENMIHIKFMDRNYFVPDKYMEIFELKEIELNISSIKDKGLDYSLIFEMMCNGILEVS